MRFMLISATALMSFFVLVRCSNAQECGIPVVDMGDGVHYVGLEFMTIQEAIDFASDGDIVCVDFT